MEYNSDKTRQVLQHLIRIQDIDFCNITPSLIGQFQTPQYDIYIYTERERKRERT